MTTHNFGIFAACAVRPTVARWLVLAATGVFLGGCSNAPTCDEPGFYESAQLGKRIEPPEDLDELEASREMVIPEPSPRPPRAAGAGCIEMPPTLRIDS